MDIHEVIAGFFTGGALAVRGGVKAARNSAIGCACLLAIIEGVGIGMNRAMAGNSRPQNPPVSYPHSIPLAWGGADHKVTNQTPSESNMVGVSPA